MPTRFDSVVVEKGKEKKPVLRFRFKGFKKSDTASAIVADKTLTVTAAKGSDERIAVINDVDIQENPEVKKHADYIDVVVIKNSEFDMNKKI
ncbi:hypothetical protein DPMN_138124 [Dreissena polymorpha]|uniref:Uncharacterized protein n=1 Tax=Dreissena polymorpha TaxID=45954 RepID=A0A9D4G3P0_DREPO|nr:hypothetical protein DPMN_138124 [Dreissena polymorpha]